MNFKSIEDIESNPFSAVLFGDRKKYGLVPNRDDSDWIEWQSRFGELYSSTQRQGIGGFVNDAGYSILSHIRLDTFRILEIGPGQLSHIRYWVGVPSLFTIADVREENLSASSRILDINKIKSEAKFLKYEDGPLLPFSDSSFDIIISFYSMEHLYPFSDYISEIARLLKPGGRLVGAIPAEGGLAWGLGRYLTTRRYIHKHTNINYDKIICWEHPNFASLILNSISGKFDFTRLDFWPLKIRCIDLNLIIKFIARKK